MSDRIILASTGSNLGVRELGRECPDILEHGRERGPLHAGLNLATIQARQIDQGSIHVDEFSFYSGNSANRR